MAMDSLVEKMVIESAKKKEDWGAVLERIRKWGKETNKNVAEIASELGAAKNAYDEIIQKEEQAIIDRSQESRTRR